MKLAERVRNLPPYLFAELDRRAAAKRAAGVDVVSLAVGDPDLPTPPHVVEALARAARDTSTHRYPSYYGLPDLRVAVADYYARRFGVDLNPDREVLPLIGSKEGLAHLSLAFVDPGDQTLVPDPGYPVYAIGTQLAGGTAVPMGLPPQGGFLPDLQSLRPTEQTKVLWLNFPSNPTAAVAEPLLFEQAVALARRHHFLLCHDAAYVDITFDGYIAPSVLQIPGARDVAVEFGSLSKTYNMTGWRVGFAVGNQDAIAALSALKTNLDSGVFNAVQRAAVAALNGPQDCVEETRATYRRRRDVVISGFQSIGIPVAPPLGSIYVWVPTPMGQPSAEFAEDLLEQAAVLVSPGTGFGRNGEGYVRVSLTAPDARLDEAMRRIGNRLSRSEALDG